MSPSLTQTRLHLRVLRLVKLEKSAKRAQSTARAPEVISADVISSKISPHTNASNSPSSISLARLPTSSILRSLFLGAFFTSPLLFRPGFAFFRAVANSNSSLLDPDRNPLLRGLIRPLVYDQFCAGTNKGEIQKTSSRIKKLGFSGVVLCYAKEVQVGQEGNASLGADEIAMDGEIKHWKDGNFQTLDMIEEGDWLGVKFSGAGVGITNALLQGQDVPASFAEAMDAVCEKSARKGCRVWVDAEQQCLQEAIDKWTVSFMRRFNKLGQRALIYNTVQAYLKSSRDSVQNQLALAHAEGWRLGIKLVRGAYISTEIRSRIHDTKAETDASYNGIARDLLQGNFPALNAGSVEYDLLLAGHNTQSIKTAIQVATDLTANSKLRVKPDFAQLQGMADDVGCEIIQTAEDARRKQGHLSNSAFAPKVYKCLQWGSLRDCMHYLTRRLVENEGAANRMSTGNEAFRNELWRRMKLSFGIRQVNG